MQNQIDRGARILAEIIGYVVSADAYHPVQPDEDGTGASKAMKWAIHDAHIELNEVDYINAHGTSTSANDKNETEGERKSSDDDPFAALAFKIATDPFVGTLTFFRVYSGVLNTGDTVFNPVKG